MAPLGARTVRFFSITLRGTAPFVRRRYPTETVISTIVPIRTKEFEAAHAYGVARFVLDIWADYFGQSIGWHFLADYDRLEIVLLRALANATAGYGFMELGSDVVDGDRRLFSLNFDIIAHEMGHLFLYSQARTARPGCPRRRVLRVPRVRRRRSRADYGSPLQFCGRSSSREPQEAISIPSMS